MTMPEAVRKPDVHLRPYAVTVTVTVRAGPLSDTLTLEAEGEKPEDVDVDALIEKVRKEMANRG